MIEALALGQSASTIEAAVGARSWSALKPAREAGEAVLARAKPSEKEAHSVLDGDLEKALLAAKIVAYAQGFALLGCGVAGIWLGSLDLARIAEIWREGCIIRSAMLDDMAHAARDGLPHGQLIFAPGFAEQDDRVFQCAAPDGGGSGAQGLPVPALSAALAYFDTMRRARGTTDLIQAQRDFFGAHGFERMDGGAGHHGPWGSGLSG